MSRFCKIGLALGGGGARGLAHLGVLQELERAEVSVDFLTGSSMGALVAAVYAQDPSAARAVDRFRSYLASVEFRKTNLDFFHSPNREEIPGWEGMFQRFASFIRKGLFFTQSLTKQAPISEENFTQNINFLLEDKKIEATAIPLAVAALDLKSRQEVVLQKGSIRKAVSASCAIPGIMPPIRIQEWELIDGGWIDRVPVRPAKSLGADFVIAVDVAEELDDDADFSTGLGVVLRTYEISRRALSRLQVAEADMIVCPDVSQVHWSDFGHLEECVWAGAEAMRAKMDEVRRRIAREKTRNFFLSPFRGRSQPDPRAAGGGADGRPPDEDPGADPHGGRAAGTGRSGPGSTAGGKCPPARRGRTASSRSRAQWAWSAMTASVDAARGARRARSCARCESSSTITPGERWKRAVSGARAAAVSTTMPATPSVRSRASPPRCRRRS